MTKQYQARATSPHGYPEIGGWSGELRDTREEAVADKDKYLAGYKYGYLGQQISGGRVAHAAIFDQAGNWA
jgi:hypothetical protein